MVIDRSGRIRLFYYMRQRIAGNWFNSLSLLEPVVRLGFVRNYPLYRTNRDAENEGAAAASAAAFASPCNASIEALRDSRGRVSSDSSSDEAAVLETTP